MAHEVIRTLDYLNGRAFTYTIISHIDGVSSWTQNSDSSVNNTLTVKYIARNGDSYINPDIAYSESYTKNMVYEDAQWTNTTVSPSTRGGYLTTESNFTYDKGNNANVLYYTYNNSLVELTKDKYSSYFKIHDYIDSELEVTNQSYFDFGWWNSNNISPIIRYSIRIHDRPLYRKILNGTSIDWTNNKFTVTNTDYNLNIPSAVGNKITLIPNKVLNYDYYNSTYTKNVEGNWEDSFDGKSDGDYTSPICFEVSNENIIITRARQLAPTNITTKEGSLVVNYMNCDTNTEVILYDEDNNELNRSTYVNSKTNAGRISIPVANKNKKIKYHLTTARLNKLVYDSDSEKLYVASDNSAYTTGIVKAELNYIAYDESLASNEFYCYTLDTPTNLVFNKISINTGEVTWDEVDNAESYSIYLDEVKQSDVEYASAYLSNLTKGTHTVKVVAHSTTGYDSAESSELSFDITSLETPSILVNDLGDGLVWTNYETTTTNKPTGYEVQDYFTGTWVKLNTVSTKYFLLTNEAFKAEVGAHIFRVRAIVLSSNGEVDETWSSAWSNSVEIDIQTLDTPVIYWEQVDDKDTSYLVWNSIANAQYYNIYLDDVKINSSDVNNCNFNGIKDYIGNNPSNNQISVRAMSNNIIYANSGFSNKVYYKVSKLTSPKNVIISSTGLLSWEKSTANYLDDSCSITYDIYSNDNFIASTTELSYQMTLESGNSYIIKIKARETTQNEIYPNPYFIDSDYSEDVTIGKYATPTNLTAKSDGYLYWDSVDNAKEYTVYNFGEAEEITELDRYSIPKAVGSYQYSVRVNSYGNITQSDMSDILNVDIAKLETPVLSINNVDEYISWNYINNAEKYEIYVNGISFGSTVNNRYYYKNTISGGTNQFYIVARNSSELVLDSDSSNIVTSNKLVNAKLYAKIKENGVWSNPIELEMPVSITDTYDNSIPRATITLCPGNRSKEYESKTNVVIYWNDDTHTNPYKIRYYVIDSDTVTELPCGDSRYYSHTLSLLDRRRELQEITMPSISITQPQDFVYNEYNYGAQDSVAPDLGGNFIPIGIIYNDSDNADAFAQVRDLTVECKDNVGWLDWFNWAVKVVIKISHPGLTLFESISQIDVCSLYLFSANTTAIPMAKSVDSDWSFSLPYMGTTKISKYVQRQWINGSNVTDTKILDNTDYYLTQRWYIRKHPTDVTDTYTKLDSYPEIEIATYNASENTALPSFKFSDCDYYVKNNTTTSWDLILEIDDVPNGLYKISSNETSYESGDLKLMSSTSLGGSETRMGTPDKHFRIVWSSIDVDYHSAQTNVTDCIYISDALKKICECANALKFGTSAKYSIDPMVLAMTNSKPIYQLKFIGKTMYECLETIGKEFLGIPYLKNDTNEISFTIRNESNNYSSIGFEDKLTNVSSSIENNSTGFVCDAVNMISKDSYEVYPGKDMWITPRATDENSAYVTTTTCGLVLDKPIAYLKDLEVTNFDDSGNTLHITPYCYEKTVYDSLSADNNGKGSAIYWQIGSNKIYGLGVLEKYFSVHAVNDDGTANTVGQVVDWFGHAFNLSPTNYAIQNILAKYGITLDNSKVKDLKFRITYIPYNDARVYLEQFNTSDSQNYSYKVYNQTDSTITDSSFGSAANKEIQRLGNNTRTTQFVSQWSPMELEAGDTIKFDDDIYYIDIITKEYYAGYVVNTVSLTKDYNKINDRIGVNSEYRQYEIYNKDFAERSLNINHYCYIGTKSDYTYNDVTKHANWSYILKDALQGNPHESLDTFYINVYGKSTNGLPTTLKYTDYNGDTQSITYGLAIHANRLTPRNSVAFSGKMLDNYAAGYYSNTDNTYENKYENKAIRYVDDRGELYAIDLALGNPTARQLYGYSTDSQYKYPMCNKINTPNAYSINDMVFENRYLINKDNRESLQFMYQMHFKTDEKNFDLHQGLTKYLFKTGDFSVKTPIIVGYSGPIANKENLSFNKDDIIGDVEVALDSYGVVYIKSKSFTPKKNYDGFALVYTNTSSNDGNLMLLSYKDSIVANEEYSTPEIYFNFKDKLIER